MTSVSAHSDNSRRRCFQPMPFVATDPFHLDARLVRRAHDRAALSYDKAAILQREIGTRMLQRLGYMNYAPGVILDAGAATGYAASQLAKRYSGAQVIRLDSAFGMLRAGKQTSRWRKLLPFVARHETPAVCADLHALPLGEQTVGMIWSNLALHWADPIRVAGELRRILKPGGLLMFSTFGPDTLKELRVAFDRLDAYVHVNRFMDMHDIGDILIRTGFAAPILDMEMITLTYEDVKQLLYDLKAIGATNVNQGRRRGLMGKETWVRMLENYSNLRRDGKLCASIEVIYGHAWSPLEGPRRTQGGSEIVRLHIKK